jgi:hypothetical protein
VLEDVRSQSHEESPAGVYIGSTPVDKVLPGFRAENDIRLDGIDALVSIWLGNRSRIAAHFDQPENMACCVAGRRRFILFPPEEIVNLYPGPIHFTPAGQIISMVDFEEPDFEKFPKFRKALENARVADLRPGDAVYVPSMWWHHVEGLEILNILINYWWNATPTWMDAPASVRRPACWITPCSPYVICHGDSATPGGRFSISIFSISTRNRSAIFLKTVAGHCRRSAK